MLLQILLWFFIILIVILTILLVAPIRYQVDGVFGEQKKLQAKVTWLFRLLRVYYDVNPGEPVSENKQDFVIKIGMYKLPPFKPSKKEEDKKYKFPFDLSSLKSDLTNIDIKSIVSLGILFTKKVIKKVAPKYFYVRGIVGLSDPCQTGQFIGFYEAATHATGLRQNIDIEGDFNQQHLNLDLKMAGRFSLASLFSTCIWLIWQKPIRRIILQKKG